MHHKNMKAFGLVRYFSVLNSCNRCDLQIGHSLTIFAIRELIRTQEAELDQFSV